MQRAIIDFHRDQLGDWVADLECGHGQHVRHRPPFIQRPWVVTASGRENRLGAIVNCLKCDRLEWPHGLVCRYRTAMFDETTLPRRLIEGHVSARSTWTVIRVGPGRLLLFRPDLAGRGKPLDSTAPGIVSPGMRYRLEANGPVHCYLEFYQRPG